MDYSKTPSRVLKEERDSAKLRMARVQAEIAEMDRMLEQRENGLAEEPVPASARAHSLVDQPLRQSER